MYTLDINRLLSLTRCVHGKCIPLDSQSYRCECVEGYRGALCNQQGELFNPCRQLACKHGRCQISDTGDAYCHCESGYTGELCDAGWFAQSGISQIKKIIFEVWWSIILMSVGVLPVLQSPSAEGSLCETSTRCSEVMPSARQHVWSPGWIAPEPVTQGPAVPASGWNAGNTPLNAAMEPPSVRKWKRPSSVAVWAACSTIHSHLLPLPLSRR